MAEDTPILEKMVILANGERAIVRTTVSPECETTVRVVETIGNLVKLGPQLEWDGSKWVSRLRQEERKRKAGSPNE